MNRFYFSGISLLLSTGAFCQDGAMVQKQLDELKARIILLEKENHALIAGNRSADSMEYTMVRQEIFEAYSNKSQLDFDFKNTIEKLSITGLFNSLMQANNPASDILGFRFTDLIFSSAERHFLEELSHEPDRKRFSQIISKIVNNPIVSSLANTNPITSVIAAILSSIIGFTTSSVDLDRDGGRIKNISVDQKEAFDAGSINAFRDEMQVYIDFYDQLILASRSYQAGLENLNYEYVWLMASVRTFQEDLYIHLGASEENELVRLARLLPEPGFPGADYELLLQDQHIREILTICKKYPSLHIAVCDFKDEYNLLLLKFLGEYIRILGTARNFPDEAMDDSKINRLIMDIEEFIGDQQRSGARPDIFIQ